ncbi:hypothetical protein ACJ6WD_39910 [Streptomyces sp. VTCC 41912]|uniref:hypothetical protein n=1 Tax=Streptomyces sp. VTCC 41912 TaxID=3383243 RepID=UPI0038969CF7
MRDRNVSTNSEMTTPPPPPPQPLSLAEVRALASDAAADRAEDLAEQIRAERGEQQ